MTDLRLGINLWSQAATWPEMLAFVRRVDALGYDSVWTWDHLYAIVGDPYQPVFEGWGMLNAWAMATERVRLGLMVGANTFRNPGLVAKQAATLDHVSGGRAILGIGGAWMEQEHIAHGIPFGSGFGQRLDCSTSRSRRSAPSWTGGRSPLPRAVSTRSRSSVTRRFPCSRTCRS